LNPWWLTKPSGKAYVYYRCAKYNRPDHPRDRVKEEDFNRQVLGLLERVRQPDAVRDWFGRMLLHWHRDAQKESRYKAEELQRQLTALRNEQDQLLNLRPLGEITVEQFSKRNTELRDRIATYTLQLEATHRGRDEHAELAQKVFELSQSLTQRWLSADHAAKWRILEIICLNFRLDGASLVPEWLKPFDVLAEGLSVQSSRGERI
jgi:site-specific DNA recombinase